MKLEFGDCRYLIFEIAWGASADLLDAVSLLASIPRIFVLTPTWSQEYIPSTLFVVSSHPQDTSKLFSEQYDLDLGESEAISSALQQNVNLFLTDDLDARNVAIKYNIEVHGTIGIILRAFKDKIIDKKTTIEKVNELEQEKY